jgi:lipopolysaccharide biosynthesis glycosyltransferase
MNLIYACVSHQKSYIKLLKLLINSISLKGNINKDTTDILIITSPEFYPIIQKDLEDFGLPICYYTLDLSSLMESSCCKLKIFSYNQIDKYQKILYLDTDVLVNSDINVLFNTEISSDKLYALEEGNISHEYWGSQFFDFTKFDKDTSAFSAGVFYFMNSVSMKNLFENVNMHITNYVGDTPKCLDQPFLVYNSVIQGNYDNQFMKKYLENNPTEVNNEKIVYHFPGGPGDYSDKFAKMTAFWKKIKNNYDTCNKILFNEFTMVSKEGCLALVPLKEKILVIMIDNRKLSQEYDPQSFWSNSALINKKYCDKFGYDFKYISPYYKTNTNDLYSCIDINTHELRHSSWSKIPVVINMLDKKYEYIVYIDSDCIFKNFDISIEEKIQQYKDSSRIFQSNYPWHPELPCAGFFILKNILENVTFLNKWYTYKIPAYDSAEWQNTLQMSQKTSSYNWSPGKHWEQDALWSLLANKQCSVTVDISEVALEEKSGQYLRHVSSVESNMRNQYFAKIFKEMIANNFYKSA